nr:hypothetical protein [Ensifer sp. BR816]
MRAYLAATFLIAVTMGLAPALDLGGQFGGVGLGAAAAGGKNGGQSKTSAGGGKKAGAAVGAKAGPSSGVRGNAGGQSHGTSTGSGAVGGKIGGSSTNTAGAGVAPATGVSTSVRLPSTLWPLKSGLGERGEYEEGVLGYRVTDPMTTGAISDGTGAVVRVCLQAITSAALPLGAVRVRGASAGPLVAQRGGALTAPIAVRIEYARQGGAEVRQARVRCHLDSNGMVIAVT